MGTRKRIIVDVCLTEGNIKLLRKGYVVYKSIKGLNLCLRPAAKDRKTVRQIDKLKKKIAELQKKVGNKK